MKRKVFQLEQPYFIENETENRYNNIHVHIHSDQLYIFEEDPKCLVVLTRKETCDVFFEEDLYFTQIYYFRLK